MTELDNVRRELWAQNDDAQDALDWAEEHPEAETFVIGLDDPMEGTLTVPPEWTWRLN